MQPEQRGLEANDLEEVQTKNEINESMTEMIKKSPKSPPASVKQPTF